MLPLDPFAVLTALYIAVSGAVGFGAAFAFLIQIGKLFIPKYFPDSSAQNWRVGLTLLSTLTLFVIGLVKPDSPVTFEYLDSLMKNMAEFGVLLMPLFIWLANLVSKTMYQQVLRGVAWIGRSYTLNTTKTPKK